MSSIERIHVRLLRIPLSKPYALSFQVVKHLDTLLVELMDVDGHYGIGESTILTGYTKETVMGIWRSACALVGEFQNVDENKWSRYLRSLCNRNPVLTTAFLTAHEMLNGQEDLISQESRQAPLIGLLHRSEELENDIQELIEAGYRTIKFKIGFELDRDIDYVVRIQNIIGTYGVSLRLDANQGYSLADAIEFIERVDPTGIELLEQPCGSTDWEATENLAIKSSIPLMLDESIYQFKDIKYAANCKAATFIKLKLIKMGGISRLRRGLNLIQSLGMTPILGNGVASDVGCWMEACLIELCEGNAGEMIGFLKQKQSVVLNPLNVVSGALEIPAGYIPSLDRERVDAYTCAAAEMTYKQ